MRSLHLFGREWLLPGGWVECAPAAGAGAVPTWVKGIGGAANPAGGEAQAQRPEVSIATDAAAHRVTCTWQGRELPWVLTRTLLVRADGAVEARYEATTHGKKRLPFLWSARLPFALDARTRLSFPEGSRLRVASAEGVVVGDEPADAKPAWPRLTLGEKLRDLGSPWSVPRRTVLDAWVDLGGSRATIQLWQGEERLTLTCDGGGVPYCGFSIDRRGRAASERGWLGRGARSRPALALRPALGAPDRFADALGDWKSVTWLAPGEVRRWTLTMRGGS